MPQISAAGAATGTYDIDDVANLLKSSTRHIRRLADGGQMPRPLRIGRLLRWRKTDIDGWIADGCKPIRTSTTSKRES